jgi:hypothetical protein
MDHPVVICELALQEWCHDTAVERRRETLRDGTAGLQLEMNTM